MNDRSCRKVNGKVVCEEDGGLFGGANALPPMDTPTAPPSRPARARTISQPKQAYPQPVPVEQAPPSNTGLSINANIPPKAVIEQTQFGEVEKLTCKRNKRTGKLECKLLTH